jgi:hypothetical protein
MFTAGKSNHRHPVLMVDKLGLLTERILETILAVNEWRRGCHGQRVLTVTEVSVGGGPYDLQIRGQLNLAGTQRLVAKGVSTLIFLSSPHNVLANLAGHAGLGG